MLIVYSLVYSLTQVRPLSGLVLLSGPTGLCLVAIPAWTAFAFFSLGHISLRQFLVSLLSTIS